MRHGPGAPPLWLDGGGEDRDDRGLDGGCEMRRAGVADDSGSGAAKQGAEPCERRLAAGIDGVGSSGGDVRRQLALVRGPADDGANAGRREAGDERPVPARRPGTGRDRGSRVDDDVGLLDGQLRLGRLAPAAGRVAIRQLVAERPDDPQGPLGLVHEARLREPHVEETARVVLQIAAMREMPARRSRRAVGRALWWKEVRMAAASNRRSRSFATSARVAASSTGGASAAIHGASNTVM